MFNFSSKIWERIRNMFIWAGFLLSISFGASYIVYLLEKGNPEAQISNGESLYWWWLETVTGIGSGIDPVSMNARLLASFVILTSLILLGLFISETSEIIRMIYARKEDGNIKIAYKNHIVIFGYTSLTAAVIKLLRNNFGVTLRIVLISNEVETNPFPGQVDFIHDNPINYATLQDANVYSALAAIILANDRFRDPDTYSLVIASGIEKQNRKVTTIVEVTDHGNRELFKKTAIDGFVDRKELLNDLLDNNPQPKLLRIIAKESELQERPDAKTAETELI